MKNSVLTQYESKLEKLVHSFEIINSSNALNYSFKMFLYNRFSTYHQKNNNNSLLLIKLLQYNVITLMGISWYNIIDK